MFRDSPTSTQSDARPAGATALPGLHLLEAAFREWVDGDEKPEMLIVGSNQVAIPLEEALERLRLSTELLAPARGHVLGLDREASVAAAAGKLLRACTDPDGPRCRSFRSASYYLSDAARVNAGELFGDARSRAATGSAGLARAPSPA
jgi:hypothetical protein